MYSTEGELWVITICQHNFIDCNKDTILLGDVDNRKCYACRAVESLHLLFRFAVNLKLLYKIQSIKEKEEYSNYFIIFSSLPHIISIDITLAYLKNVTLIIPNVDITNEKASFF